MTRLALFALVVFGISFLVGLGEGQLVTPVQACEMQCIRDRGESIANRTELYHVCTQYCLVHAYDQFLVNLGTLG